MKRTFGCTLSPVPAEVNDNGGPNAHPGYEADGHGYTAEDECLTLPATKRSRNAGTAATEKEKGARKEEEVLRSVVAGSGGFGGDDSSPEGLDDGAKRVEELNTRPNRSEAELEAESLSTHVFAREGADMRRNEGGCLVAEGYEEVLTFLGTLVNEFRPTNVTNPSAILIGSRAAYHWDDTLRMPANNDWNLVILPWALENWLACNQLNVSKPGSSLRLYEYVLPNPRLAESVLPRRHPSVGNAPTVNKLWRVDCVLEKQVLHFEICAKYLYDQSPNTQQSSICLLFEIMSKFMIKNRERISVVKQFPGGGKAMVAPLCVLEAIKRSHVQWPGYSWHKHMNDMHAFRNRMTNGVKSEDAQWEAEVEEFTQCRYRETEQRLGIPGKQLSLFTSWNLKPATASSSLHNTLHRTIKNGRPPFYEELQRNHVLTSEVFESLRLESKMKLIREELMTLTLERRLDAAKNGPIPLIVAYADALERFCTVNAKGGMKKFALDQYPELAQYTTTITQLCLAPDVLHVELSPTKAGQESESEGSCPVLEMLDRVSPRP